MTDATDFGTEALLRQVGLLAKQRREERGIHRPALAKELGIDSEQVFKDFEFGRSFPPADIQRKLEKALDWKLSVIEEVARMAGRPAALTMDDMDAEHSLHHGKQGAGSALASASDEDLLAEVARRGLQPHRCQAPISSDMGDFGG